MTDQRYRVEDSGYGSLRGFAIYDDRGRSLDGAPMFVDKYRTRSGAEHAARLLEAELAIVDWHAVLGCRVVPLYSEATTAEGLFAADAFGQIPGQMAL